MKKVLLTITAAAMSLALSAQTSQNIEFNDLTGSCTVDKNIVTNSPAYTINGISGGSASISTSGDQLGYHQAKFFFKNEACEDKSIDLADAANQKVRIKLSTTAAIPGLMFFLIDKAGNANNGNDGPEGAADWTFDPQIKDVPAGDDQVIDFTIPNTTYGTHWDETLNGGNGGEVQVTFDIAQVAAIQFYFRNKWCDNNGNAITVDNTCDGTIGSVISNITIDYIRVGSNLENGIIEDAIALNKTVSALYNLQGQAVSADYQGLVIVKYSDGTVSKILQ